MEKKRAGESSGRRLTPGERAVNWAKAAVTAWPIVLPLLAALGWTNKDHIQSWVITEADGQTEVLPGGQTFEEMVAKFTTEIAARVDEIEGRLEVSKADLSQDDRKNYAALAKQLKAIDARLTEIEEVVQP